MSKNGLASLSFTLPNGVTIAAYNVADADWEAIDVQAEYPSGYAEIICSVDYERTEDKLRVFVHNREQEDPVYEQLDYFGLSCAAVNAINLRLADIQSRLENNLYEDEQEESRLEEEKADLLETLRLARIPEGGIVV